MPLHPAALLPRLVQQHSAALARLHWYIQQAVPETFARFHDRHPKPADLHGMVLCTTVRDAVHSLAEDDPALSRGASLTLSAGPALSVVLRDGKGMKLRARRWPSDQLTGDRKRVVTLPDEPTLDNALFEVESPAVKAGYDLFVLWWPDLSTGSSAGAELAAVRDIDDPRLVQIIGSVPLPAASAPPVAAAAAGPVPSVVSLPSSGAASATTPAPAPVDDFDEELGDEGEQTGIS